MSFEVLIRSPRGYLRGTAPTTNARHAITTVAQFAGLAPSVAGEVLAAGEDWATILAGAGYAFCCVSREE